MCSKAGGAGDGDPGMPVIMEEDILQIGGDPPAGDLPPPPPLEDGGQQEPELDKVIEDEEPLEGKLSCG